MSQTRQAREATVKETPILMCGDMVRAILDGRKSMTRRIIKPQPPEGWSPMACERYRPAIDCADGTMKDGQEIFGAYNEDWGVACKFGGPGDQLWVRETWQTHCDDDGIAPRDMPPETLIQYPATYDGWLSKKRPGIFMPKWACRLWLELTEVRVERVQDITEADARCEGAPLGVRDGFARAAFVELWDKINGPGAWKRNDWTWALVFRRLEAQP